MGAPPPEEAPRGEDRGPVSGRGILVLLVLALTVLFLGLFATLWVLWMP